jgi:carbonic anhydrase
MAKCELCQRQSPIDIITSTARYQEFRPFSLRNYEKFSIASKNLRATNTGGTVKLLPIGDDDLPTLQGGPLNVAYEFVELHFHWGEDESDNGSEHRIDGKGCPLEVHLVHKNIHDATLDEALTHENGLAVIGFKFAVVGDDIKISVGLDTLTKLAREHLVHPGVYVEEDKLPESQDVAIINFLPLFIDEYFNYSGSLTTGTCNEAVNWIVFKHPLAVHKDNLRDFQSLMNDKGERLINNFRPVQPANDRPLYYHGTELLVTGTISKGNGKTARSHEHPNQREHLLTVPGHRLAEIAPLAKSDFHSGMSEIARKMAIVRLMAGGSNRSVSATKKYAMIWYNKVMAKKRKGSYIY